MRWRRLQEKIEKDNVLDVNNQTGVVPDVGSSRHGDSQSSKRRNAAIDDDTDSASEGDRKKVKLDYEVMMQPRQTREKKENLKYFESSSSGVGSSIFEAASSAYEESLGDGLKEDEDDDLASLVETLKNKSVKHTSAKPFPVAVPKVVKTKKADSAGMKLSSKAGSKGYEDNTVSESNFTKGSSPIQAQNPSQTSSGYFSNIVQSIKADDNFDVPATFGNMQTGKFITTESPAKRSTSKMGQNSPLPCSAGSVKGVTETINLEEEEEDLDMQDLYSLGPEDSISVTAPALQGGLKRKKAAAQNSTKISLV
jgi:hypothetical protein